MSYSRLRSALSEVKRLALPAVTASTAYLCHDGIQTTRPLNEQAIKSDLKDQFSLVSSAASAIAIAFSAGELLGTLASDARKLDLKQGATIVAIGLAATAGAAYSMVNFGVEHTTASSGYAAAASATLFQSASALTAAFARKNDEKADDLRSGSVAIV